MTRVVWGTTGALDNLGLDVCGVREVTVVGGAVDGVGSTLRREALGHARLGVCAPTVAARRQRVGIEARVGVVAGQGGRVGVPAAVIGARFERCRLRPILGVQLGVQLGAQLRVASVVARLARLSRRGRRRLGIAREIGEGPIQVGPERPRIGGGSGQRLGCFRGRLSVDTRRARLVCGVVARRRGGRSIALVGGVHELRVIQDVSGREDRSARLGLLAWLGIGGRFARRLTVVVERPLGGLHRGIEGLPEVVAITEGLGGGQRPVREQRIVARFSDGPGQVAKRAIEVLGRRIHGGLFALRQRFVGACVRTKI